MLKQWTMQLLINTVLNGWSKTIYYTITHQILALIQQPASISNWFFGIKKCNLRNFCCECQLGNEDSRYSLKQNIFNFPNIFWCNFIKDEKFEEETLSSKILQNLRILPCQNSLVVDFFCKSDFALKRF